MNPNISCATVTTFAGQVVILHGCDADDFEAIQKELKRD